MKRIFKTKFTAAHFIKNHPRCGKKHSHEYKLKVTMEFQTDLGTKVGLVSPEGRVLDERYKAVYPSFSQQFGKTEPIRPFFVTTKDVEYGGQPITILPLICYEIVFPKLWMKTDLGVDFVTHHMRFPMFDVFQLEGWRALHEAVCIFFDCDVVCSCGGIMYPMNLSGIIKRTDKIRNYNHLYKTFSGGHRC